MASRGHLAVGAHAEIPLAEIQLEAARAGGPGGQRVNKVATKVVLRFRPSESRALSPAQKHLIAERLASRLGTRGELVLHASKHRERSRNVADALERLASMLAAALEPVAKRRATRPTRSSVRRRLTEKRKRSDTKDGRRKPSSDG